MTDYKTCKECGGRVPLDHQDRICPLCGKEGEFVIGMDADPEAYHLNIQGFPPTMVVTRVAETWQFFAFVFAAVVTIVLALLDEIPDRHQWLRIASKVVAFFGLAYFLLWSVKVRGWLSVLLVRFKEERS